MKDGQDDVNLADLLAAVWRHRGEIALLLVVTLVTTAALSFAMPKTYSATAALLGPKEDSSAGILGTLAAASGLIGGTGPLPLSTSPILTSNRDKIIGILKSRTVAETAARRFRLHERYETKYFEDAVKRLQDQTSRIDLSKEGVVLIAVEDRDPRIAADIANFYLDQVEHLLAMYGVTDAGQQRVSVTKQMAKAKAALEIAEDGLRRFQERNRAIVLQDQTRIAIEAAVRLKGEILASETQLQVLRNFATDANSDVIAMKRRIEEMKRQLVQMQYGDGPVTAKSSAPRDFYVPFSQVPEVGLELVRLTREVKVQEAVVTLLTQQLEQTKFSEAKEVGMTQVLDRAVAPERSVRPDLSVNLAIAGVTAILFGCCLALLRTYAENLRARSRTP